MDIKTLIVGPIQENCYIAAHPQSKEAVVIDPGDEADMIIDHIREHELKVKYILLTHGHHDHIGAVAEVKKATGALVAIHADDQAMLVDVSKNLGDIILEPADMILHNNDVLSFGGYHLRVIYTPGHTQGGCCYYEASEKVCFTGDTLFKGTVGRTDLYGGDYGAILVSVRERLAIVADDCAIFPGHGPSSTMAYERKVNPYVR